MMQNYLDEQIIIVEADMPEIGFFGDDVCPKECARDECGCGGGDQH